MLLLSAALLVVAPAVATSNSSLKCNSVTDPQACVDTNCLWCAAPTNRGCLAEARACDAACCVTTDGRCDLDDFSALLDSEDCGAAAPVAETAAGDGSGADAVGVGFSGGGSRAFATALGWVRAMTDLGLWRAERLYVIGVSGSCWFLAPFAYGNLTTGDALGPYVAPGDLTLDRAGAAAGAFAGYPGPIFRQCAEALAAALLVGGRGLEAIWRDVIFASFLAPAGIGISQPFFESAAAAAAAQAANPGLFIDAAQDSTPLAPRDAGAPAPHFGGTMEGPTDLLPLAERTYFPLVMGPRLAGTGGFRYQDYAKRKSPENASVATGGFVDTWALGAIPLRNASAEASVLPAAQLFSLAAAVGIASMAPAQIFTEMPWLDDDDGAGGSGVLDLTPTLRLWAPAAGSEEEPPFIAVGDGGQVDNYGILHLLQRGHSRVVIFDCSETPLATSEQWDPYTRNATSKDGDEYIPALFGQVVGTVIDGYKTSIQNNHVFEAEGLPRLISAMQASNATGLGIAASVNVTTVANELFEIEAGRAVDLTWVYLDAPQQWLDALPDETRSSLGQEFPEYSTLTRLDLTVSEVTILSNLCSWVVRQHEELLRAKLA